MAAALVVLMVDCCNRHDTDALAACYAPDTWVHPAGWPQAVDARTRLATFGVILATFPDLRLHPRNLAANGRVALRLGLVQRVAQVEAEDAGISAPISPNRLYDPQDRPCGRQHHWARASKTTLDAKPVRGWTKVVRGYRGEILPGE
jgi:hypothetical protein